MYRGDGRPTSWPCQFVRIKTRIPFPAFEDETILASQQDLCLCQVE